MIIVTGGAGFIGSNIVKGLNERGREDILIVDNLTNMVKFKNIQGLKALDYMDKQNFIEAIKNGKFDDANIEVIFHEGACSDTMEYNGKYMMENNFEYTKTLMHFALKKKIQLIYASSASTYGSGKHGFSEKPACEEALNVYAFSKLFFDNYARRYFETAESQIVGLRYFNVYGPQENHKGKMASMIFQMFNQWKAEGKVKLFEGIDGYGNGEQVRDFIYVKDVVKVNFFFWDHPELKGIYNCGTGHAHTFNTLAKGVLKYFGSGELEYVPFPEVLRGKYQSFTEADSSKLLAAGYDGGFTDIEEAIAEYCALLDKNDGYLLNER
ncbi:MAG: ADP-glyceromanno-heptose 6-epimerase [Acholeplasmataceae bacterium]|nr:ADP-glyceromanno-heptose 6-epimerase [Acholeplasmataceae bacterium]